MTQPKRSTPKSTGARKAPAKRTTAAKKPSAARKTTAGRRAAAKRPAARKTTADRTPTGAARAAEARTEERIRELNERIIEGGKELGTAALDAYEAGLSAIAKTLETGPGKSDQDWVARVANGQAEFLRDLAKRIVPPARRALK